MKKIWSGANLKLKIILANGERRVKMKKIFLLFLICFLSCSLAKTWNSYTYLECDKRYEFNQDSIVFVDSTQANQGLEFYLACENSFGDEFPVYDSLGRIVDWEYGKYTFKDYMLFFEYAESNRDSLWISSFYENNVIDTIEIKRFKLLTDSKWNGAAIPAYFSFLYKRGEYNAFCYVKPSEDDCIVMVSCEYQDDGTFIFDKVPQIHYDSLKCKDFMNLIKMERAPKQGKNRFCPYKVNGIPASKNSSNIVIQNKKQPKLKLKGNR